MIPLEGTWLNNPAIQKALWPAVVETLQMVGISGLATLVLGLPLGILLFLTRRGSKGPHPVPNRVTYFVFSSVIVNIIRSIPYAVLMVALMKVTERVVGTSIGPVAASVSLSIAAIPFFARLVESSLRDVHVGKLDAAIAMGSTKLQWVTKVLLPEALPSLVACVTTTIVTLVGYSAMAGLIGGGGLGRLAYNYGHQRNQPDVMILTVIVLIVLVQAIQWIGDRIAKAIDHR